MSWYIWSYFVENWDHLWFAHPWCLVKCAPSFHGHLRIRASGSFEMYHAPCKIWDAGQKEGKDFRAFDPLLKLNPSSVSFAWNSNATNSSQGIPDSENQYGSCFFDPWYRRQFINLSVRSSRVNFPSFQHPLGYFLQSLLSYSNR